MLGDAFCRLYSSQYDIIAVCRRRTPGVPSQDESYVDPLDPGAPFPENAGAVHVVYADLEADGQIDRVVDVALARFGGVDLLVNNAAHLALHPHGVIDGESALRDADRLFHVNVTVPLELSVRLAQRFWRDRDVENRQLNRNVVNVSSRSGSTVYPNSGQALYATSKAALNHLTRHLGSEFAGFGVRVNAVAPTSFPSLVSTESVARAVVRLDQDTATGRILTVDPAPAGR